MSRSCFHYGRGLILHKITELSSLSGCIRQPLSASCLVAVYLLFRVLLHKLQQISVSVCRKASADADRENYHSCKCCAAAGCLANKQTKKNKQTTTWPLPFELQAFSLIRHPQLTCSACNVKATNALCLHTAAKRVWLNWYNVYLPSRKHQFDSDYSYFLHTLP